jgi:hypothetical protein
MYSPPSIGGTRVNACITRSLARFALASSTARAKAAREAGEKSDATITVRMLAMSSPPASRRSEAFCTGAFPSSD